MRLECPVYGFTNKQIVFLDPKLFLSKFFEVFIYVWIRQSLVRIRKSVPGTIALVQCTLRHANNGSDHPLQTIN
jgi:hypothetical protein